jgi:hypothetical protein
MGIEDPSPSQKFRTIKDFLVPFSRAIFFTKGDIILIDRILFIIDILINYFQRETIGFFLSFSIIVRANYSIIGRV